MPDKWYTKMRQTPAGCHVVITAEDIRNKVRALEMAPASDSILVSSVTRRVAQVPPSGGSSILTEDSVEPQPHVASTTASIVSQVSEQIEESMQCSYGASSITGKILTRILMRLDELGIVGQGIDKNGDPFYPALIIDGHILRLSLPFLEYINKQGHRWWGMLMCPYGTSKCQFHDHEIQNASFKCKLVDVKCKRVQMYHRAGFPADLCMEEIPIIVKEASDATYAHVDFAIETCCIMGYVPFTHAVLDDANILSLTSQEVLCNKREQA
jgi:hypothetical protein